jgi:hypothetical protein
MVMSPISIAGSCRAGVCRALASTHDGDSTLTAAI